MPVCELLILMANAEQRLFTQRPADDLHAVGQAIRREADRHGKPRQPHESAGRSKHVGSDADLSNDGLHVPVVART